MQAIDRTDLAVAVEGVESRTARVGDVSLGWMRLPVGADLRSAVGGVSTHEAGQACYRRPGHAPAALTDCG